MTTYTPLTPEQRYQIYALMKAEHNQTEVVTIVGVDKSTVSRELRRNRGLKGYRPKQAHELARNRRHRKAQPRITPDDWRQVERLLREDWSPEQISLWLAKEKRLTISHEWIYPHILQDKVQGGDLYCPCAVRSPARNAMAPMTVVDSCRTGYPSTRVGSFRRKTSRSVSASRDDGGLLDGGSARASWRQRHATADRRRIIPLPTCVNCWSAPTASSTVSPLNASKSSR